MKTSTQSSIHGAQFSLLWSISKCHCWIQAYNWRGSFEVVNEQSIYIGTPENESLGGESPGADILDIFDICSEKLSLLSQSVVRYPEWHDAVFMFVFPVSDKQQVSEEQKPVGRTEDVFSSEIRQTHWKWREPKQWNRWCIRIRICESNEQRSLSRWVHARYKTCWYLAVTEPVRDSECSAFTTNTYIVCAASSASSTWESHTVMTGTLLKIVGARNSVDRRITSSHSLALRRRDTSQYSLSMLTTDGAQTISSSVSVSLSNATPYTCLIVVSICLENCALLTEKTRTPALPHAKRSSSSLRVHRLFTFGHSVPVSVSLILNWSLEKFAGAQVSPFLPAYQRKKAVSGFSADDLRRWQIAVYNIWLIDHTNIVT